MAQNYIPDSLSLSSAIEALTPAYAVTGNIVSTIKTKIAIAAADADNDEFIFAQVPDMAIIDKIAITNSAITAGTAYRLGLYVFDGKDATTGKSKFTAVGDADQLSGTGTDIDMSSARAEGAANTAVGVAGITVANRLKRVYELAGHTLTNRKKAYYLGFKAVTAGTAAGTIGVDVNYISSVQ